MAIFGQFPWVNFHDMNLDWVIKTVKECQETVASALEDVSDAVSDYFAAHIDTTLTVAGDAADALTVGNRLTSLQNSIPAVDTTLTVSNAAADAAIVGQKITNLNSNYTTLNGTVGGLTTSVLNLNTEVGKKADAVVIDGDNSTYLKGGYATLHTLLEDNHKSVDVWVKSGTVYYKALQVSGGPDERVIIMCKYADRRFHYLGCDADNTITGISSDPSYCVVFDIDNTNVVYGTKVGAYSTIKTMYDNYGPYDIVVKISNFDQAIPYNVWFNGMDMFKIYYKDSSDNTHYVQLTQAGVMTVV